MNDWYSLGVALRVHPNKLQEIQKSSPREGIQRWRIDLLQHWLSSTPNASWSMIVVALERIDHHVLAARLRAKYQIPQTTLGTAQTSVTSNSYSTGTGRRDVLAEPKSVYSA